MARLKKASGKPLAQILSEYRAFFLMALGAKDNFITEPDVRHFLADEEVCMDVIHLIPSTHSQKDWVWSDSSPGGTRVARALTPAAYAVYMEVRDDLKAKIDQANAEADNPWLAGPGTGEPGQSPELARADALMAELEKEEAERKEETTEPGSI